MSGLSRRGLEARLDRECGKRNAAPPTADDAPSTPQQKLLRAAETGQFEALVHKAQPAEPVAMVTPEEREAELRAAGRWPAEKREPPPAPEPEPSAETPLELTTPELTPNEQYIAEHCHWRRRRPNDYRERHRPGRCLTEYDVLADADEGYDFGEEEGDEW